MGLKKHMQRKRKKTKIDSYQASALYVAIFYGLLFFWTIGTVPLIIRKLQQGLFRQDFLFAFMIGFFYLFTWFWSLGLFYRITLNAEGKLLMKSLRRALEISAQELQVIEGSRFASGFGFIRFKLPRESAYLFCHRRNNAMEEILRKVRRMNPVVKTARI